MKLPSNLSGEDLVNVSIKLGFQIARQKGSHLILKKGEVLIVIPLHKRLKRGTLLQILKMLQISKSDLQKLL